jgi:hypothetical protein
MWRDLLGRRPSTQDIGDPRAKRRLASHRSIGIESIAMVSSSVEDGPTGTTAAARARLWRRGLFAVAVIGAIAGVLVFRMHITSDPFADARVYYDAAARLNAGQPLYPPDTRIYPPLFSILFRPLALLPFEIAAAIWEAFLLAAFGLTLWRMGIRRPATWLAIGMLGIGIAWTFAIGQAEVLVTLLLTIGSPFTVALAANIKLFPILVGVYWLGRREWRELGRLVGWTVGLILLQLVLDPADSLAFPGTLNLVRSQAAVSTNLSPYATSPLLWAVLVGGGVIVALRLAPTRWGWASAVALEVLASPRLFSYMLMSLLACLGGPEKVSLDPRKHREPIRAPGPDRPQES